MALLMRFDTMLDAHDVLFRYRAFGCSKRELEAKTYVFSEGDSAHYDPTDAHRWHNTGECDALLIRVGTPSLL